MGEVEYVGRQEVGRGDGNYSGGLLSSVVQAGGMLVSRKSGCVIGKYLRGMLSSAV